MNNIVYYGLVLNTPSLGGNIYVNYVIGGVMELIGYAIAYLVSLKCVFYVLFLITLINNIY